MSRLATARVTRVIVFGLAVGLSASACEPAPTPRVVEPAQPAAGPGSAEASPPPAPVISAADARLIVEELYGMVASRPLDVLAVHRDGELYRVVFRTRGATDEGSQVAFLTTDGRYLIEDVVEVERHRRDLIADRRFADCLLAKGVRFLVEPGDPQTQQQLAYAGRFAPRLAVDCTAARDQCEPPRVPKLPATLIGDEVHPGLRTRAWLESVTTCK